MINKERNNGQIYIATDLLTYNKRIKSDDLTEEQYELLAQPILSYDATDEECNEVTLYQMMGAPAIIAEKHFATIFEPAITEYSVFYESPFYFLTFTLGSCHSTKQDLVFTDLADAINYYNTIRNAIAQNKIDNKPSNKR